MNKHVRKLMLVTAVALMIALAGCGAPATQAPPTSAPPTQAPPTQAPAPTSAPSGGEPIPLTIWQVPNHPEMEQVIRDLVKPYEQEHNVKVDVVIVPWDTIDQMWTSAIQSGDTPSFGYTYDSRLPDWYKMGALEPLEGYADKAFWDQILDEPLKSATYQGHIYAFPVLLTSDLMYYNKDLFDKAGIKVPDDPLYSPSWDEFLDWTKKLAAAGFYGWDGSGFQTVYDHIYDDFYMRFGCKELSDDYTQFTFDSPGCLNAAKAWQTLGTTPNLLPPKALTVGWNRSEAFLEGKAGMLDFWVGLASRLETDYPNIKWGVMRPFHEAQQKDYLGIGYYAVFKDAKNKQQAVDLALWLSQPAKQTEWNKTIGLFPAIKGSTGLYEKESPGLAAAARVVETNLSSGDAKFVQPWSGNVRWGNEVFVPNLQALMLGKITPEDFVKKVHDGGVQIFQEMNK